MKLAAFLLLPRLLTTEPPAGAIKLNAPRVQMRNNEASATRSPWVDSNGWRFIRTPNQQFYYQANGDAAMLAAAESFTYNADALISTDAAGKQSFEKMLDFLSKIPEAKDLKPVADFGVIDDGTDQTGEVINLLTRQNLLFQLEKSPDAKFKINLKVAATDTNPSEVSHKVRAQLGDDHRSLRIYGSEVVVARYTAAGNKARVSLINYSNRPVRGLRIRVSGAYKKGEAHLYNMSDQSLADWTQESGATEFSIPELGAYAIIDLTK
jgi:hypothetical protein